MGRAIGERIVIDKSRLRVGAMGIRVVVRIIYSNVVNDLRGSICVGVDRKFRIGEQ